MTKCSKKVVICCCGLFALILGLNVILLMHFRNILNENYASYWISMESELILYDKNDKQWNVDKMDLNKDDSIEFLNGIRMRQPIWNDTCMYGKYIQSKVVNKLNINDNIVNYLYRCQFRMKYNNFNMFTKLILSDLYGYFHIFKSGGTTFENLLIKISKYNGENLYKLGYIYVWLFK